MTALQKGSIAAAILFRPSADLAISQGMTDLARYDGLRAYPTVLYAVNKEWAAKGDAGKRVAQAIQHGHAWMWEPKNRAESIAVLAKYTKRDTAMLERLYGDYFGKGPLYSKTGEIDVEGLKNVLADIAEDGLILKAPAPAPAKFLLDKNLGGLTV